MWSCINYPNMKLIILKDWKDGNKRELIEVY